jgi:hypothetical protein
MGQKGGIETVEVVTLEDFNEFRKNVEEKLDAIDKNLGDLIDSINENQKRSKADVEDLNKQIVELADSSRGFVDRLREALHSWSSDPSGSQPVSNAIGEHEKTIGRVADVIVKCPNFFEWDFCHENCPMYMLCDEIAGVQDTSKLSQSDYFGRLSGAFKRLEGSILSRRKRT